MEIEVEIDVVKRSYRARTAAQEPRAKGSANGTF